MNRMNRIKLNIIVPSGEKLTVTVGESELLSLNSTVKDLKDVISEKISDIICPHDFRLLYGGKRLKDSQTLGSYCVTDECDIDVVNQTRGTELGAWGFISLVIRSQDRMYKHMPILSIIGCSRGNCSILVKNSGLETFNSTVKDLKDLICKKVPDYSGFCKLTLLHSGDPLEDSQTLTSQGVRRGCYIYVDKRTHEETEHQSSFMSQERSQITTRGGKVELLFCINGKTQRFSLGESGLNSTVKDLNDLISEKFLWRECSCHFKLIYGSERLIGSRRTLESYGIKDGDRITVVPFMPGGGVPEPIDSGSDESDGAPKEEPPKRRRSFELQYPPMLKKN